MAVQDQVSEVHAASGAPQEDRFSEYRISVVLQKSARLPEPTSGYLDLQTSAQGRSVDMAQATEGDSNSKSDRATIATDQQISGLSTFLNSNTVKPHGQRLRLEDRQLNDRTAEWLRNRFEEELAAGGNPMAMQRRMNEMLASQGLAVQYTPQVESSQPYRLSQLRVVDARTTRHDLSGNPYHPTVGFASGSGMAPFKRT